LLPYFLVKQVRVYDIVSQYATAASEPLPVGRGWFRFYFVFILPIHVYLSYPCRSCCWVSSIYKG